jgi:tRNA uridine 5-carboxymethylaminomethyl modification enzyme
MPRAIELGLAGAERVRRFRAWEVELDAARQLFRSLSVTPNEAERSGIALNKDGQRRSAYDLLSYPEMSIERLTVIWPQLASVRPAVAERLETEARYAVYLHRQQADVAVLKREEARPIPADLDFSGLPGLSNELKQKLATRRPTSIAEASRIDGMTPAALAIILARIQASSSAVRGAA